MSIFPFRRQTTCKSDILRGVYEENLRILGRGDAVQRFKRRFPTKGYLLLLPALVLLILFKAERVDTNYIADAWPTEKPKVNGALQAGYISLIESGSVPLKQVFGLGVKTIVIDPGHGGADPGTAGKIGLLEKDITLDIAKILRDRLERHGLNVLLTREADETVPLTSRAWFANSKKADLFISIHVNYVPFKPINIIETYYFGPSKDDETLRLASVENADSHYRLGEFRQMIEKMGDTLKLQESKKLAAHIQESLYLNISGQNSDVLNYGIKTAPFVVLLGVEMPAVLAEVSCISNSEEEIKLHSPAYRESIAQYLESGILNYLKEGDSAYEARARESR